MPYRIIQCEKCGSDYRTSRQNTKVCAYHAFVRDYLYANQANALKRCGFCERKFRPVVSRQAFCFTSCGSQRAKNGEAECAICHQERIKVHADVAICYECMETPGNFSEIKKLMRHKDGYLRQKPVRLEQVALT